MGLRVLLIAAVAGVVAHVPARLGVVEAVSWPCSRSASWKPKSMAAMLAYRAIYHLAPLALAIAVFLVLDGRSRKQPPPARHDDASPPQGVERPGR